MMAITVHVLPDPMHMCGASRALVRVTFKGNQPGKVGLRLCVSGACTFRENGQKCVQKSKVVAGAGGAFHVSVAIKCRCDSPSDTLKLKMTATVSDASGQSGSDSAPLTYRCRC